MKITHVTTRILRTPPTTPSWWGSAPTDTRELSRWSWAPTRGSRAIGLTFFGGALTPALRPRWTASPRFSSVRPFRDRGHHRQGAARGGRLGPGGIFTLALSAIDIAAGTSRQGLGRSVAALLGGCASACRPYASGALVRRTRSSTWPRPDRGWLMSHNQVDVGPMASRITSHGARRRRPPSALPHCISSGGAHLHQPRSGLGQVLDRVRAHERAARVGRHALARPPSRAADRAAEGLALEVPARDVDRGECQREDPAGPRAAAARRALAVMPRSRKGRHR